MTPRVDDRNRIRGFARQQLTDGRGFTLVELIMVIIIATVAMAPLLSMFANATVQSVQPELITQAVFLAQERIETVLADYQSPARGYAYVTTASYPPEAVIAGFPGFSASATVSPDSIWDGVTFRAIAVTVSHPAIESITLHTWVTQ